MPIRDAHLFMQTGGGPCFANRGVSGIDGNIATAAGVAAGLKRPILALIGDLACLYDLNALALLHSLDTPVVLCVVNNQGGGIFSFLPIAEQKTTFERFVAAAHPWNFEHAAALFHLPYLHPTTPEALQSHVHKLTTHPTSCLIEITTDRQENVRVHESLLKEVCSSFGIFLGESVT
jgi:2-succinyl-5-enolpyruvyl-6-hydroxy-3-cyclohexene-1-carboxylate synthase